MWELYLSPHPLSLLIRSMVSLRSCVRFVMSDRSGMGKSLYIKRLAESLTFNLQCPAEVVHVTIPLHGPVVTPDSVLELFQEHANNATCCIYHIDIAPKVSSTLMKGTKVQTLSVVHTLYIPWHSVKIESDSTVYVTGRRPSSPWTPVANLVGVRNPPPPPPPLSSGI